MKMRGLAGFVLLTVLIAQATAQGNSDLSKLDEKFTRYFGKIMPGWRHDRVDPLMNGENVLIQFWSSANRKVKISVIAHKSGNEAREVLQRYAKYSLNKEVLTDIGEEGYSSGYGSADVAFRKGRFTIYISTTADVDSDQDAKTLNQNQRFEREKSEMRRWSREFAKHAANAVDNP